MQIDLVVKKHTLLNSYLIMSFPIVHLERDSQTEFCFFYSQLRDPKVRKMAELLEKTNSSYFPSFKNIFRDVVAGEH